MLLFFFKNHTCLQPIFILRLAKDTHGYVTCLTGSVMRSRGNSDQKETHLSGNTVFSRG